MTILEVPGTMIVVGDVLDRLSQAFSHVEIGGHVPSRVIIGNGEAEAIRAELLAARERAAPDSTLMRMLGLTGLCDEPEIPSLAVGCTATLWGVPVDRVDETSRLAVAYADGA